MLASLLARWAFRGFTGCIGGRSRGGEQRAAEQETLLSECDTVALQPSYYLHSIQRVAI